MKPNTFLLIVLFLFGSTSLTLAQTFLEATIIKKDGTEVAGLVHEDLIKYGKKCLFKKSPGAKRINYSPDHIQAVKFKHYYVETKKIKRMLPEKGLTYESLFLIKILDGEVDLYEKGITYKEKGHYILFDDRLIHIQPLYDKMPASRYKTFKRNKKTLKTLFDDCNETNSMVEKKKKKISREFLINLVYTYNKCKGVEQNILRH